MTAYQTGENLSEHAPTGESLAPLPAYWECTLADNSLRWSPGVYDLFGLPRGSALVRDATADMYLPESRALLDKVRAEAIAHCRSFTFDAQIRRPDGAIRWMRLTADVEVRDGKAFRLYGTKQDVTAEIEREGR